ncbi:MAG TPA: carboxyltransferase domain-containing protein [Fimbriimonadaceae bacterium]|nr:carboxyltransferase domain-containing protein [Fimbriimonadaceae bacterium]
MRIEPLGDLAYILRDLEASPAATALALDRARLVGMTDAVPCADTVGVYARVPISYADIEAACATAGSVEFTPAEWTIPVCYEFGEDLEGTAEKLGLTSEALVRTHSSAEFACFAIGFCPGFAYLGPLPESLRGVPRLGSPRVRTEPGSVGMTGNQTAVYPMVRPGGWPIVGRTPLVLVDVESDYFPISVGDRVRFEPVSPTDFERLKGSRL